MACLKSDRFKQIINQFFENYPKNQSTFQQLPVAKTTTLKTAGNGTEAL
jgi:hypothetical protein|nr:hypothetical protein [uncultured Flavobacterium sp.]